MSTSEKTVGTVNCSTGFPEKGTKIGIVAGFSLGILFFLYDWGLKDHIPTDFDFVTIMSQG